MGDIEVLKALADETRFRMMSLLLANDLCVGALAHRLGISPAAVSQHLQILRRAGLVRGEKRGYWTHYVVNRDSLAQMATSIGQMASSPAKFESVCRREPERVASEEGGGNGVVYL